ncbi:hypothetical protein ACFVYJ_01345 [Pontibacter sp. JAM-7]|uniref:hypothetical protein n=1 Tax=Pontibacter sp. JAM-7 TaxID=3366581 RepID=UPI003AF94088
MSNVATMPPQENPFDRPKQNEAINQGAVAIEQERAIAEARGQIQLAKMFPRSISEATAELLDVCKSPEFAESAFYSVPNRGSGPSIRFAEEVARVYSNFQYGHRELSRSAGKSEVEVYAWDVEKNNRSTRQITVNHVLDYTDKSTRKKMSRPLHDQADIDNRIANIASKQMRGRILALVPKSLVAIGIAECRKTLAGNNTESLKDRTSRMIAIFSVYGISVDMLGKYIGHSLDNVTTDDIADLTGVYNAIKEGARISDYFESSASESSTSLSAKLEAPAKTPAPDMPDFGDVETTPVAALLEHLANCSSEKDLNEWKAEATKWAEGSIERTQLIDAYKTHKSNLQHAAANQEA